jgi:1,4-alpha-glucan branching enzyme
MTHRFIQLALALSLAFAALAASCGPRAPGIGTDGYPATGPREVEGGVQFVCFAPKAHRVVIVGDFNDWSVSADPMYDREEKGIWSITLPLRPGRYEYKFLVDGDRWIPDAGNPRKIKDGFGADNSVVEVKH